MANQRLELTWVGKGENPQVEPRILLHDPSKDYGDPNSENMLIHGDNLLALKALEQEYAGKVKCIYIDPPYNTGEAFDEYDDNLEHSIWLHLMYNRLKLLKNLLAENGVIFVQLNDDEINYCKVMMDEIFGRNNFINLISIKTKNSSGASGGGEDKRLKKNTEFILCYGNHLFKKFYPVYTTMELSQYLEEMRTNEISFKYTMIFTNLGKRIYYKTIKDGSGNDILIYVHSGYNTKSVRQLAKEEGISEIEVFCKYYEYICTTENAQTSIRTRVREATDEEDNLYSIDYYPISGRNKGQLTTIYFVGKNKRLVSWFKNVCVKERGYIFKKEKVGSLWSDLNWNNVNREGEVVFTGGKKPEVLIKRILELATEQGDLVLDSFLGSGTTAAVAHKMGRRWIGIELGNHCYSHCKPRLDKVIEGEQGGISKKVEWQGGGGYKFYELAPTLIVKDKYGNPVFSDKYNAAMLTAAVAKINGFFYAPDKDVYWKQGRSQDNSYIYVTTQYLTAEMLDNISCEVSSMENLLICAPAFDIGLSKRYDNINVRKIPQSVLSKCEYGVDNYNLNIINPPEFDEDEWEDCEDA
ncbi:MAG: site-specific DNA-methyltransferase [Lachnospiraceae bacterium]|nr:site-specific DNA-methyltransferase [Lachnospiraceae bacterium]